MNTTLQRLGMSKLVATFDGVVDEIQERFPPAPRKAIEFAVLSAVLGEGAPLNHFGLSIASGLKKGAALVAIKRALRE